MKRTLMALLALATSQEVASGELDRLAWLAGHWVGGEDAYEEVWLEPRGGTMTGSFRWVFPNGNQVLEFLVIEESADGILFRWKHFNTDYVPWEKEGPNVYRLESLTDHSVSFVRVSVNDRVPLRYSYTLDGDRLKFRGEGRDGEEPLTLEFRRR